MDAGKAELLQLLLARLERVAVDSHWAHRASGIRGGLIRSLEEIEAGKLVDEQQIHEMIRRGFQILERAAREKAGSN